MVRTRMFRVAVGGLAVAMGLLMAVPAGASGQVVKIKSPKAGEPGYPTCITPTHVTNNCSILVKVKGAPKNTEIAIVECNSNEASGDTDSCSSSAGSGSGEAVLVETNSLGKAKVKDYPVLVSSTQMLGDGYSAVGDTCYILVANVATQTQIGSAVAFTAGS